MKRGGSKMGYTEQFNLLSPCYKDGEQPAGFHMGGATKYVKKAKYSTNKATKTKPTKKGSKSKQRGGTSCYASPSVSEMGVVDKPSSNQQTATELAWGNRMKGGQNNASNLFSTPVESTQPVVVSTNNTSKPNQLNNISTYLEKLSKVVFDKDTQTGFAIVVERTKEDPANSKNDKYTIKVIKINNTIPSMSVLDEQPYSNILQTVRDTSSELFPLKKTTNSTQKTTNVATNTKNLPKSNKLQTLNNRIQNNTIQTKPNLVQPNLVQPNPVQSNLF